jgi:hypothetical protein
MKNESIAYRCSLGLASLGVILATVILFGGYQGLTVWVKVPAPNGRSLQSSLESKIGGYYTKEMHNEVSAYVRDREVFDKLNKQKMKSIFLQDLSIGAMLFGVVLSMLILLSFRPPRQ